MNTIDRRHNYVIMLDTETSNTYPDEAGKLQTSSALVYDIGVAVADTRGNIYETHSFTITETFVNEADIMQSAYYADKIPQYWKDINMGSRSLVHLLYARKVVRELMEKYHTNIVVAHNARFDVNALNSTIRYITKSEIRYFFPYGTEIWDTMMMAGSTICKQKTYKAWCIDNGYMTKNNQVRKTAEILFRYLSNIDDFEECHTGLEDVLIETQIMARCFRTHKKMKKVLYEKA